MRPLFTWRDALLGGGFVIATLAIHPLDKRAEDAVQQPYRQKNQASEEGRVRVSHDRGAGRGDHRRRRCTPPDDLSNNDRLAELGLHGTEALFIGEGVGTCSRISSAARGRSSTRHPIPTTGN